MIEDAKEYGMTGRVPIVGLTSPDGHTITFAARKHLPYYVGGPTPPDGTYADDPEMVKHELIHAMTGEMHHPSALFAPVMAYRGR